MECPVSNSFEVWLVCDCHLAVPQYSLALLCLCKLALCVLVETDAEHSTIKMEMKNCLWVRSVRIHNVKAVVPGPTDSRVTPFDPLIWSTMSMDEVLAVHTWHSAC